MQKNDPHAPEVHAGVISLLVIHLRRLHMSSMRQDVSQTGVLWSFWLHDRVVMTNGHRKKDATNHVMFGAC